MRNKCIFDHSPYSIVIRLTHWGRVTHICVSKLTIIGSDNGLSPDRRQAITWTSDGILLIGPIGTSFSETLSKIQTFSLKKMRFKVSSAKWRAFCLDLNVLSWSSSLWRPPPHLLSTVGDRNRPISPIPQCTRIIPQNAPFCNRNVRTCSHFCYKMLHCGTWDYCIVGVMN